MLSTYTHSSIPAFYEEDLQDLEVERFFRTEEDAIYSIYEQLFNTQEYVCEDVILKAMKYLVFKKKMSDQINELRSMTSEDVCVEHKTQVHKAKNKLNQIQKQLLDLAYLRT